MKVKDWYNLLLKKYATHQNIQKEKVLIPTRLETIYQLINHKNSFENIRKKGLPSKIMSVLFKIKYDLYLTEEKKRYTNLHRATDAKSAQKWIS